MAVHQGHTLFVWIYSGALWDIQRIFKSLVCKSKLLHLHFLKLQNQNGHQFLIQQKKYLCFLSPLKNHNMTNTHIFWRVI